MGAVCGVNLHPVTNALAQGGPESAGHQPVSHGRPFPWRGLMGTVRKAPPMVTPTLGAGRETAHSGFLSKGLKMTQKASHHQTQFYPVLSYKNLLLTLEVFALRWLAGPIQRSLRLPIAARGGGGGSLLGSSYGVAGSSDSHA